MSEFRKKSGSKDGLATECRECGRARDREWNRKNRDQRRAYRERTKKERSEYAKQWYARNPGYRERYYRENKEASYERRYRWIELNPEKHRAASAKRRAAMKGTNDLEVLADYMKLIRADPCVYCGSPAEHVDHIIALAKRGAHEWDNLAPTCATCNTSKATHDVLTFMLRRLTATT
ncbi:HNH endonuclease signature motif containing protein [Streptomyces sp. ECR3.8]|uniref:HNH endonuclease signature motif containing protein n=1 Tax=Streptomyces sp. ECR3.8 TaxID=3461009 RepID=UPI0040414BB2